MKALVTHEELYTAPGGELIYVTRDVEVLQPDPGEAGDAFRARALARKWASVPYLGYPAQQRRQVTIFP